MKNYYEILEVHPKASLDTIKKVFKLQIKKYHPDLVEENEKIFAEEKVKELNEAYDVLSDEQKRKEYDNLLNTDNNEIYVLENELKNLQMELNKKDQIIEHFLGGLDLSEYENAIYQEHQKFKENVTQSNANTFENFTQGFDENQQNFSKGKEKTSYSNDIYNKYVQTLLMFIARLIGLIVFITIFLSITSKLLKVDILSIFKSAFFE